MQRVLGALQMVSEPDPDRCVNENAKLPKGGWMLHPTSVGKVNEVLLIRGMDTLPCMTRFGRD